MAKDPVVNIRLRFVSLLPSVRQTLRTALDTPLVQRLVDSMEPLSTKDPANDVKLALSRMIAKAGPMDLSFSAGGDRDTLGLGMFSPHSLKPVDSITSLTDLYLMDIEVGSRLDAQDRALEEEEQRLSYEVLSQESSKKPSKRAQPSASQAKKGGAAMPRTLAKKSSIPNLASGARLSKTVSPSSLPTSVAAAYKLKKPAETDKSKQTALPKLPIRAAAVPTKTSSDAQSRPLAKIDSKT